MLLMRYRYKSTTNVLYGFAVATRTHCCVSCSQDLTILTDRLSKINEALARKTQARNEYDRTIQETEAAYMKVRMWLSQHDRGQS